LDNTTISKFKIKEEETLNNQRVADELKMYDTIITVLAEILEEDE
jgi:hypothetical protein